MRTVFLALSIGVLGLKTNASSYGYFADSSCSEVEALHLEDICLPTKNCERMSFTSGGTRFPGTAYNTPLCAQSDEAIQALFAKGTELFVIGYFKDTNCTEFKSPTTVYIADNNCHQNGYNHGYRVEIESGGDVVVHPYYSHDCSGLDTASVYDRHRKEKLNACSVRSKAYFLTGTRDANGPSSNQHHQSKRRLRSTQYDENQRYH